MTARPVLEIACACAAAGHPGTADYSSAPCPLECWQPGHDASVRVRAADLTVTSDYEAALDEHGIECPNCEGEGGGYVDADDGHRWLECRECEGRGVLLPAGEGVAA